ncbi:Uncharacterised protein [Nocardia cyriacigeorgica]|uniref:Uncharacterized protein n=1 Tax=Nocardia cyriacigeorgica TaxID=135487 RepID=A0A4U8VVS3_9NOCA|nr:Uncharacterised protein [Nocardia cyriacigeorgica]
MVYPSIDAAAIGDHPKLASRPDLGIERTAIDNVRTLP